MAVAGRGSSWTGGMGRRRRQGWSEGGHWSLELDAFESG